MKASSTSAGLALVCTILISTASSSGPKISTISAAVAARAFCFIKLVLWFNRALFRSAAGDAADPNNGARLRAFGALGRRRSPGQGPLRNANPE
ncbi:MAG: hypothetical protein JO358_11520 [Alphaproteobacteria bacterium]|nr:hypothetical protein [Alphaproteobacteria bacterium]